MSSIEQCIRDINNYNNLEEKIKRIVNYLGMAVEDAGSLSLHIENNYQVDGDGAAVVARVVELKNELKEIRSYLKKNVLPGIGSSLSATRREKSRLEEEND